MKALNALGMASMAIWLAVCSVAAMADTCRIDWHPRGAGLLAVFLGDRPYKGKAYVAHDDVVRLREVLIATGECQRDLVQESCSVRQTSTGRFQIHFGAKPLYKRETHHSSSIADKQLQDLVQVGFCTAPHAKPRQFTASSKPRKLKISQ